MRVLFWSKSQPKIRTSTIGEFQIPNESPIIEASIENFVMSKYGDTITNKT